MFTLRYRFAIVIGLIALAAAGQAQTTANAASTRAEAWRIVSRISGVRTQPPTDAPSNNFPDGPLMGNGSLGVAIQGRNTDHIALYLSREDFWSVLRGRIMPMGRLNLSIPSLHNGTYKTSENIGPADVTGRFTKPNGYALTFKSWVANPENLAVLTLRNVGHRAMVIRANLLDGWGTPGAAGMSGILGGIHFLNVSPDTVDARVGEPSGRDPAGKFNGAITDLKIFAAPPEATPSAALRPCFSFLPQANPKASPPHQSTRLDCGNLAMPQRAFKISAWVYPRSARGQQAIFSAMTSDTWQHWMQPGPNPPQISYGFAMSTINGRLSALLNRVRVTAPGRLPLNQWSHIVAVYNGMALSLRIHGQNVAATRQFPEASQVIGPRWDWAAIHPGDRQLPFDGCSPKGLLAYRVLGVQPRFSRGRVAFTIEPGRSDIVLISGLDDRDAANYQSQSIEMLRAMDRSALKSMWHKHVQHWRAFWSRSYIQIPDRQIKASWYGSLYLFACASAPGHIAPGLWGNFVTSPNMDWNGDYTLDYNYEAPYWAAYPTNHVALAENYDAPLLGWMHRGAGLAKHRHYHGLFYYCHLSPLPGWSADGAKSIRQKADALFGAVDCLMRWRYTRNAKYARRVYPFLRGVARFWDHYLVERNGVFIDENDAADELQHPNDMNPATTIAFLRMLYGGLLDIQRTLHLDDPAAERWHYILQHLSPLPIFPAAEVFGPAGMAHKRIIRYTQKGTGWSGPVIRTRWHWNHPIWPGVNGSSAGMNPVQAIFPGWAIGLDSSPKSLQAGLDTVHTLQIWYDFNDTSSYYPAAAAVGYNPIKILRHLNILIAHCQYPNFVFQMGGGGTENFATVPTTICAMFLQSYQKSIRVFPNWPRNQNAAFGHLLACGDFLISSRLHNGRIAYVRIACPRGGVCRLANPWPGKAMRYRTTAGATGLVRGARLSIKTTPGEMIVITSP